MSERPTAYVKQGINLFLEQFGRPVPITVQPSTLGKNWYHVRVQVCPHTPIWTDHHFHKSAALVEMARTLDTEITAYFAASLAPMQQSLPV